MVFDKVLIIIEDGESGAAELEPVRRIVYSPEVLPLQSPRGHEVTRNLVLFDPSLDRPRTQ